jgi:hypothetical protein
MLVMSKTAKRPRATRREKERALGKLATKLDRLVQASPGGSPQKAITVDSASVVEVKARAFCCGRCEGELLLLTHEAEFLQGAQYRRVEMQCRNCFVRRCIWFVLGTGPTN